MLQMSLQKLGNEQGQKANKQKGSNSKNNKKHETKVKSVLESNTNTSPRLDGSKFASDMI